MLPLEGCKPIFVDSTCCPVRYDCNPKILGKSSQEVLQTKISNKHFLRMSQRLQRNRGCTVGKQFYVEGQKMKSDVDKPCDICFCIRGIRRCAPKKCAPALKNCLPVVPKGQCCPSSYDCDHQRDYRRATNSRQFNLYNLFFNDDVDATVKNSTIPSEYPHDRSPALATTQKYNNNEQNDDSFFAKIRQGLEFIDTNHEPEKLSNIQSNGQPVNKDELSLLDLLLEPETEMSLDDAMKEDMEEKTTNASWLDLLLGKDEDTENYEEAVDENTKITTQDPDISTTTETKDLSTTETTESTTDSYFDIYTETTTNQPAIKYYVNNDNRLKLNMGDIFERNNPTTKATKIERIPTTTSTEKIFVKMELTTKASIKHVNITTRAATTTSTTTTAPTTIINDITNTSSTTSTAPTAEKTNSFLSAIFDGISGMLGSEKSQNKSVTHEPATHNKTTPTTTTAIIRNLTLSTQKPLPSFRPLPSNKTHTRINSKIANLTLNHHFILQKPPERNLTQHYKTKTKTTSSPATNKNKIKASATVKPIPIKTILDAEPLEQYIEPTLPPSLPNLKIIPFLPTDAVKVDRNKPTSFENYYNKSPNDKIDYDLYEDANMYPLLTERFPTYSNLNDENKAEYIYKFNIEGPPVSTITGSAVAQGFSPPTKTEGGFVPKDPIAAVQLQNDYQYIIDITTANSFENATKPIIEITTPNIFKNVIRTEPPPDLISLMTESQTKNKILSTSENLNLTSNGHALETYSYLLQKILTTTSTTTERSTQPTTSTVPPFKSMPTVVSTTKYTTSSPRPTTSNEIKILDTTVVGITTVKQLLHKTTTPKSNKRKVTKPQTSTTSTSFPALLVTSEATKSNTAHFQSPFDKLPFMDTSFNIKSNDRNTTPKPSMEKHNKLQTIYKQLFNTTTNHHKTNNAITTIGPILHLTSTPATTKNRLDPFGALKLAGCNIYGRMYRVNRVIVELSNKCRECKCTEIGVECKRLDC